MEKSEFKPQLETLDLKARLVILNKGKDLQCLVAPDGRELSVFTRKSLT